MSSKCLGSFSVNMFMGGVKHFYCRLRNLRVSGNKNKNNSLQFGNYAVFRLSWPLSYLLYNPSQSTITLEMLYSKKTTKPGKPLKMVKFLSKQPYFVFKYNCNSFLSQASLLPLLHILLLFSVCKYLLIAICAENENSPSVPLICIF